MKCPVCATSLQRIRYEGLPVFRCDGCLGYLLGTKRMTDISRNRTNPPEQLLVEAKQVAAPRPEGGLRCPRCRAAMECETWRSSPAFQIDTCVSCDFVWLDAGELGLMQLAYEATPKEKEASAFRDRLRTMTPAERAQFEADLAQLPDGDATLASAFGHGLTESWTSLQRRMR